MQGDEYRTLQVELKDALYKNKESDRRIMDMITKIVHFTKEVQDLQNEKAKHEAALAEHATYVADMEQEMANLQEQIHSWDHYYWQEEG